ncbi:MAG: hypothetical protein WB812_02885 [Woeseiaceae bacterium]
MTLTRTCLSLAFALLVFAAPGQSAHAEPYLAVQKGMKCGSCHTSPSGGGKRTRYGDLYAQTELAAHKLGVGKLWTGELGRWLALGGDARGGWDQVNVPGESSSREKGLEEFLAYVEVRPFPKYLTLYVDARLRPDDPLVREKYVRLSMPDGSWAVRAGQFFLPYGLRLQDDEAFIRQVGGINYNTPDTGWEIQYEHDAWTAQFAVTRGTAGGPEIDSGKQYSLRVSRVMPRWRLGGSLNYNDSTAGDRQMQNVFAGLRTGPVVWLAELDYIIDDGRPTGRRGLWASLVEANYEYRKGHNLKLTYEWFDPDDDVSENERTRMSLVWEYSPMQFVQARVGYRTYDGIPQNPAQNRDQLFAELHIFF